jgi:NAD(P)-dependent dehydrogenase (short-subunit alcohol dehydrogenase family)
MTSIVPLSGAPGPMVLVTGTSSGIGRAIALCLSREGFTVFAGVRTQAASEELRSFGLTTLIPVLLDVTDAASIASALEQVRARAELGQPLYALINNAAVCVCGPLESLPLADLEAQFAVNLFGLVAVTQAALPLLLAAKGRIVNIGSNVGRLALPFLGPYAATKAAIEALTDAWRRELKPFGVHTSLVIPGPVMTPVWDKIERTSTQRMDEASAAVKQRYQSTLHTFLRMNYQTAVRSRLTSEDVGQRVLRCLRARSPAARYEVGVEARLATLVSRSVPAAWVDGLVQRVLRPSAALAAGSGRALSGLERMYYYFNHWSSNSVVAICELDGCLGPALLERALGRLMLKHPLLRQRVAAGADGSQPHFVSGVTSASVFRVEDAPLDCAALVAREMALPVDPHASLLRVTYARDAGRSVLLVSMLHIIADATSAMLVLRGLLEEAAHCSPDQAAAVLSVVETCTTLAPDARLPSHVTGVVGLLRILVNQLRGLWQQMRARPARLAAQVALPFAARRNGYVQRMLKRAQVDALREAGRANEVTVHGLLTAALALALAEELGLRETADACLNVGSPVNLRDACQPPVGDELGSYVCTLGLVLRVGRDETCWSIARQVKRELSERAARREALSALSLIKIASPKSLSASERAVQLIEDYGPGNVCISNIGEFAFPERVLDVPVRAAHWTAPLSVTGYFLCAVCTTSRGLSLDFSYVEEMVDAARAGRIVERMLTTLTGLAAGADQAGTRLRLPAAALHAEP